MFHCITCRSDLREVYDRGESDGWACVCGRIHSPVEGLFLWYLSNDSGPSLELDIAEYSAYTYSGKSNESSSFLFYLSRPTESVQIQEKFREKVMEEWIRLLTVSSIMEL